MGYNILDVVGISVYELCGMAKMELWLNAVCTELPTGARREWLLALYP